MLYYRDVSLSSAGPKHEVKLPPGHTTSPAGQAAGPSKCPFLAAEMVQKNNRVVREASMELQEDVQEMHTLRAGRQPLDTHRSGYVWSWFGGCTLGQHLPLRRNE